MKPPTRRLPPKTPSVALNRQSAIKSASGDKNAPTARLAPPRRPIKRLKTPVSDPEAGTREQAVPAPSFVSELIRESSGGDGHSWNTPLPGMTYLTRGKVIAIGGQEYVSIQLNQSNARIVALSREVKMIKFKGKSLEGDDDKIVEIESRPRRMTVSREVGKEEIVRVMTEDELKEFLGGDKPSRRPGNKTETGTNNQNENDSMKTKTKKATKTRQTNKSGEGKMAFIERHLLAKGSERKTKSEIVALTLKQFPGSSEQTIKNTVSWCASCGLPRKGKVSNHLEEVRESKPAKDKKPAKGAKKMQAKPAKKGKPAKSTLPPRRTPPSRSAVIPSATPAEQTEAGE